MKGMSTMENRQYERPEITVISIEPDEKLMGTESTDVPGMEPGVGPSAIY